ncbi:hypothetical protein VPH35_113024 [Triticum aestivum]|uniref:uncharacterized protein n=1 Tax=Triticum aestivum TaxID=4565 RepID=UPI000843F373|nr:uncharacterized protein LOC123139142 [Triticum aestivum]XP_044414876.1 uncharacterized protein LOC123139142 [Triticum aestivum]XP_044414878.1 uncharacterized protein LOC123139142 [Triticum aestivum]
MFMGAAAISGVLLLLLQTFGDAAIDGLNNKTHMKILLKWMWGKRIIKLSCTQLGNTKKSFNCAVEEKHHEPRASALECSELQGPWGRASRSSTDGRGRRSSGEQSLEFEQEAGGEVIRRAEPPARAGP